MKKILCAVLLVAFAAGVAAEQAQVDDRIEKARAARSVAFGVDLIKWDQREADGGWQRWWVSADQATGFEVDWQRGAKGAPGLVLKGAGRNRVFGGWKYEVSAVQPGKYYRFFANVEAKGVPDIRRNILCRIRWTGANLGNEVTPDYVTNYKKGQGYSVTFDQEFSAPEHCEGAVVELLIQWVPTADVLFREVSLKVGRPAQPRLVTVATVFWDGSGGGDVAKNIAALEALLDKAAAGKPDLIVLPERLTSVGTGFNPAQAAEALPGDLFFALSAKARQHKVNIVYGAYEREETAVFNSCVIIGRDGSLKGVYRKVQLAPEEAEQGVAPGKFFKTFELDFGKVGVLLSRDAAFAESARVEMLDGAEMIIVPMTREDRKQLQARAMDNGLWVVSSGVETPSAIIDPAGSVVKMAFTGIGEVAVYRIDLEKKVRRPWVGDWRNQVVKERRTDAYLKMVQE